MAKREHEIKEQLLARLEQIPDLFVLEPQQHNRLGYISFYINNLHHNLIVRLLNDRFGIQTRGGCSCAGTYGHILFNIDYHESERITHLINEGDLSKKPGWVRVSLHPTMTNAEVDRIVSAISEIIEKHEELGMAYTFDPQSGDFVPKAKETFRIDLNETFQAY